MVGVSQSVKQFRHISRHTWDLARISEVSVGHARGLTLFFNLGKPWEGSKNRSFFFRVVL